ncbi:MAG TPA: prolyl oligopeptidase family serine peptidase [Chitinophaga sp.]|uniref:S9 family peptidase n=1 Tax=Chitinophaga sp. TaxID=1869181 RepID=UPI002B881DC2|nr:prolyl oligopeptidase family serine peptidase [Chitinophaga sp.]HVI45338.1 prolyl oligopeptidase family serine peptidase [Chitinophaga sp.]
MTQKILFGILLCWSFFNRSAIAQTITRFQPTHAEIVKRYQRATRLDSITRNTIFKTNVDAHWQPDGRSFWYRNDLQGGAKEYMYVDAVKGARQVITDTQRLVRNQPPQNNRKPHSRNISPDKQWEAYIQDGNVYVKATDSSSLPIQFTTDGSTAQPYGYLAWSPDSKYLAGYLIHPVKDTEVYYVLTSEQGSTRGQLRSQPYKQPGDAFTTYTPFLFHLNQRKASRINTGEIDFLEAPEFHWRSNDPRYFVYEKRDRGHQRFRVIEVDAQTAATRTVIDEKSTTFIYESRLWTFYPSGTNYLFYTSEKDGWRHLYMTDLVTGKEQQVTKGNWVVRDIDSIDVTRKEVWFSAGGINEDEDPYHLHYYRIGFNGRKRVDLTPEKGHHHITYSPDKAWYIDNYSQVNVPPVTKLRRTADGSEVLLLETADISRYQQTGVRPPEVFVAKGRDGVTDIWGIVSRPSDFDPNKKYPVLENIYAGPQSAYVPKSFTHYSEMQSLAELGFIVVMIDGMGTANRSKAFHDVCWKNLADGGFPDRILWIKALAAKYPSVDTTRVGLYGTSAGGQNTLGGLLFHPEFYKAGVAACGCHDNRVDKQWWNEQWMGYPVGKHYEEQSNVTNAAKLKGRLLLIVGEADTNVPPESTYRVADALIKAGKDFEFLPIPGMGHSDGGAYGRKRKRDFFVRYLLGVEPPVRNIDELSLVKETGRERWEF